MEILPIVIERQDGGTCCGILEFRTARLHATLLWTVEWEPEDGLLVEFFPGSAFEDERLIRRHQQQLIASLLEALGTCSPSRPARDSRA